MLDPGTLIAGRYEILSPLASGGNGLVYAAIDRTTEKRVAVKVLRSQVLHERAAREKLRLEAIVAGRVESEHIVQVSDAGVDSASGVPFLVMELLKGFDLQHWVEQQGPIEKKKALEYLRQVASGLDKAHSWKDSENRPAPIVHRDLKPENLYLTHREDRTPLIKILDFGLAKVLSGSATMSSEVRGTPLYMAPEQLSQAPVTPATDVWAIGLIAFFFLTGKCYWKSGQSGNAVLPAVLKEVGEGPTVSPQSRLLEFGVQDISLSPAFDEWFRRCVKSGTLASLPIRWRGYRRARNGAGRGRTIITNDLRFSTIRRPCQQARCCPSRESDGYRKSARLFPNQKTAKLPNFAVSPGFVHGRRIGNNCGNIHDSARSCGHKVYVAV